MRTVSRGRLGGLVLLWPAIVLGTAFLAPLGFVAARAVGSGGDASVLASPYLRGVFAFTLKQAFLSTVFSIFFGLPGAFLVGRCRFVGRKFLLSLSTVPFVLPPILAVLGFILVFGNSGILNDIRSFLSGGNSEPWKILYSLKAVVMAHVFYNFPITLRLVGDAWEALPQSTERAARSCGASPFRTFMTVDLPALAPSLATSALVTFLYCFLSFAVVLVLGGGPELSTLEVEVYRLVKHSLDFEKGSAVALAETATAFLLLILYGLASSRMSRALEGDAAIRVRRAPRVLAGKWRIAALAYAVPAFLLVLAPLAAVVVDGFLGRTTRTGDLGWTLRNWRNLFGGARIGAAVPILAVVRSLALGGAASLLTVATAAAAARFSAAGNGAASRTVGMAMAAPLGVSSVILGLGYLLALEALPRSLFARTAALVLAHVAIALPFSYRILLERFRSNSRRISMAARSCGAGPLRAFLTIELPMAKRAVFTAAVFSLAISAGEMNAAIILAPEGFTTMPLAVYRMIGAYDIHGACALGTILIAVSAAAFAVLDRYGDTAA